MATSNDGSTAPTSRPDAAAEAAELDRFDRLPKAEQLREALADVEAVGNSIAAEAIRQMMDAE